MQHEAAPHAPAAQPPLFVLPLDPLDVDEAGVAPEDGAGEGFTTTPPSLSW